MSLSKEELISRIEREIMTGRGRWIAHFNESFRDFRIRDVKFDVFIKGNTRMKGFLLSRLFSHFLNPNYEVAFFILSDSPEKRLDGKRLQRSLSSIRWHMERNYVKWSWLIVVGKGINDATRKAVESVSDQTVGVLYVDSDTKQMIHCNSYLGRQMKKYIKV